MVRTSATEPSLYDLHCNQQLNVMVGAGWAAPRS